MNGITLFKYENQKFLQRTFLEKLRKFRKISILKIKKVIKILVNVMKRKITLSDQVENKRYSFKTLNHSKLMEKE